MCNFLHDNSTPIPASGIGYKIFGDKKALRSATGYRYVFRSGFLDERQLYKWTYPYLSTGDGFCFVLDKKEALDVLKRWNYGCSLFRVNVANFLFKIEYFHGLGEHDEHRMLVDGPPVKTALCKEFIVGPMIASSKNGKLTVNTR